MSLKTLVAAAVLNLAASAQGCATIPLCCNQLIYEPTAAATSTANSLGVTSPTYPIGVNCIPIEDPPVGFIPQCAPSLYEVCCKENNWGKRIAAT
ncbi:hypothetical protein SCLCIDRAFT_382686 [Scleroderma citrinum Foug A]|uniref:Uncharacterized protein n=1 Tax=Scleroderma citrinum Foug A TaxID=1036808 RepID=A0A0C3DE28_9AGAM|nr:hypothetical protein SCLCIDRAFT_382686 [Scleroderma citrinum Foug A]